MATILSCSSRQVSDPQPGQLALWPPLPTPLILMPHIPYHPRGAGIQLLRVTGW